MKKKKDLCDIICHLQIYGWIYLIIFVIILIFAIYGSKNKFNPKTDICEEWECKIEPFSDNTPPIIFKGWTNTNGKITEVNESNCIEVWEGEPICKSHRPKTKCELCIDNWDESCDKNYIEECNLYRLFAKDNTSFNGLPSYIYTKEAYEKIKEKDFFTKAICEEKICRKKTIKDVDCEELYKHLLISDKSIYFKYEKYEKVSWWYRNSSCLEGEYFRGDYYCGVSYSQEEIYNEYEERCGK